MVDDRYESNPDDQAGGGQSEGGGPGVVRVIDEALALVRSTLAHLIVLKETGVEGLPLEHDGASLFAQREEKDHKIELSSPTTSSVDVRIQQEPPAEEQADHCPVVPAHLDAPIGQGTDLKDQAQRLDHLRREVVGECTRCKLASTREAIVFGKGNPRAELMFIGGGPGEDEDRQGLPFVGLAGELLDRIVSAMGLEVADTYQANVVKCCPPLNRDPDIDEILQCETILARQIQIIRPKVLVALGRVAATTLLRKPGRSLEELRRGWHVYLGVSLKVTYHPAHLLEHPQHKKQCWSDIQQVMDRLGLTVR